MRYRRNQKGISILGFIVIAAMVVCFVMVGFRVTPAYIEYYSVQKALQQSLYDVKDLNSTAEVRNAFQRRADAGYIESVSGKDIEVVKTKNEITATATWTRKLHLVGNVSLFLDFDASATR
jgi:hypothetical protein